MNKVYGILCWLGYTLQKSAISDLTGLILPRDGHYVVQDMRDGSPEELTLRQSIEERRARVADITGDPDGHLTHLTAALAAQKALVLTLRGDFADVQAAAQQAAGALAARVSALHEAASRLADARAVHASVLRVSPALHEAALAVARLDLRLGDPGACEERVRAATACVAP